MPVTTLILLTLLFFATSVVGVVTGSNSLVTVPVMFQFGIDEKVAVATNMFGLTFMAIGGTIPFFRRGTIEVGKLSPLLILTIIGSALGATLVGLVSNSTIKVIVSVAMLSIVVFTLVRRDPIRTEIDPVLPRHDEPARPASAWSSFSAVTLLGTFILAIYGGLYSGGYVTVLTAVLVAFSGMSFVESVGATKLINVFSSGIATLIFMWQGLVYYKLGVILAVAMFAGAFVGAHFAVKLDEVWLKRIFLTTVFLLAIKTLVDFL